MQNQITKKQNRAILAIEIAKEEVVSLINQKKLKSTNKIIEYIKRRSSEIFTGKKQNPKRENIKFFPKQYSNKLPSRVKGTFWINAWPLKSDIKTNINHKERGKWMLFYDKKYIDFYWEKIQNAINDGLLGTCKVSTRRKSPTATNHNEHVICVYCSISEAEKYRDVLYSIGISQLLCFKLDSDTAKGKYRAYGDTKISKLIM